MNCNGQIKSEFKREFTDGLEKDCSHITPMQPDRA